MDGDGFEMSKTIGSWTKVKEKPERHRAQVQVFTLRVTRLIIVAFA